jgi:hypothetical protein
LQFKKYNCAFVDLIIIEGVLSAIRIGEIFTENVTFPALHGKRNVLGGC